MADEGEDSGKGFEMLTGLTLAVLAAVLAVTDLGGGRFGDDELIAHNEKSSAFQWYSSKGIKQSLTEGQIDTLEVLLKAGSIAPEVRPGIETLTAELKVKAERYGKEKKEILLGSSKVGQENWAQDVDGEMGKVVGAEEYEALAAGLGEAGDWFDYSTLFLQLCLVMGAISLVIQSEKAKWGFYGLMVGMGVLGSILSFVAFSKALAAGA